ncbi:MAG: hypothetical protein K2Q22_01730, partial [Cytophagales bacterium]|nr:hypothetical protein [Cytophagales bacterium]
MKKEFLTACLCFGLSFLISVHGQSTLNTIISQIVKDSRDGKAITYSLDALYNPKNTPLSLEFLNKYSSDSSASVRFQIYSLTASLGQKSGDVAIKKQAIISLLKGTQDMDPTISEMSWNQLLAFPPSNFQGNPMDVLTKYSKNSTPQPELWAKTMGYLFLKSKQTEIKSLIESNLSAKQKWQIHLALARMGESSSTEYILTKISKIQINDDWIISLMPDLVYTQSRPIFNLLFKAILDTSSNCQSAHPDSLEK